MPLEKSCFRLPGWLIYSFTDENHKVCRWPESSLSFCLFQALWQTYCVWRDGEIKRPSSHGGKHADTAHKGKSQLHGIQVTVKHNSNESFHNPVKHLKMPVFSSGCLISFILPWSSFVHSLRMTVVLDTEEDSVSCGVLNNCSRTLHLEGGKTIFSWASSGGWFS